MNPEEVKQFRALLESSASDLEVIATLLRSMKVNLHFHPSLDAQIDTIISRSQTVQTNFNSILPRLSDLLNNQEAAQEIKKLSNSGTIQPEMGEDAKKLMDSLNK